MKRICKAAAVTLAALPLLFGMLSLAESQQPAKVGGIRPQGVNGVVPQAMGRPPLTQTAEGGQPWGPVPLATEEADPSQPMPSNIPATDDRCRQAYCGNCGECYGCPPGECECSRPGFFSRIFGRDDDDDDDDECRIYSYCVPPLGASIEAAIIAQRGNAEAARMVLYDYDFIADTATLKPRGIKQLNKIAAMLASTPYPFIIEVDEANPALAAARRQTVLHLLAELPFPVPEERVVVGYPPSRAFDGTDAEVVHRNLIHLMIHGSYRPYSGVGPGIGIPAPIPNGDLGIPPIP